MELSQSISHRDSTPTPGLVLALASVRQRLSTHHERLVKIAEALEGSSRFRRWPAHARRWNADMMLFLAEQPSLVSHFQGVPRERVLAVARVPSPKAAPEAPSNANPFHHLKQVVELVMQRASDLEIKVRTMQDTAGHSGPEVLTQQLGTILHLAGAVHRTRGQAERARQVLVHSQNKLDKSSRHSCALYHRILTLQQLRLRALGVRADDLSLLIQRLRRYQDTSLRPVATPASSFQAAISLLPGTKSEPMQQAFPWVIALKQRITAWSKGIHHKTIFRVQRWLMHPLIDTGDSSQQVG